MTFDVVLGEGERVEAVVDGNVIVTDKGGAAPAPFDLFLASIGTCTGTYIARFCSRRGIPTSGIRIRQRASINAATRLAERIELDVQLPEDFPDRYRDAVVRAAGLCTVKKQLERPPEIRVETSRPAPASR